MIEVRTQTELDAALKNIPGATIVCVGGGHFTVSGATRWGSSTEPGHTFQGAPGLPWSFHKKDGGDDLD